MDLVWASCLLPGGQVWKHAPRTGRRWIPGSPRSGEDSATGRAVKHNGKAGKPSSLPGAAAAVRGAPRSPRAPGTLGAQGWKCAARRAGHPIAPGARAAPRRVRRIQPACPGVSATGHGSVTMEGAPGAPAKRASGVPDRGNAVPLEPACDAPRPARLPGGKSLCSRSS